MKCILALINFLITSDNHVIMSSPFPGFLTGWVNRFAHAGDAAVEIAGNTAYRVRF